MPKPRGVEAKLSRLRALKTKPDLAAAADELRQALADKSNLVIAGAAAVVGERKGDDLAAELVAAFDRLMIEPEESDKLCRGKIAIAEALDKLEYPKADVFLRGIRHMQFEPVWGGSEDSAAPLRGRSAFALVRIGHPGLLLLLADLLADEHRTARSAAVQALGATGAVAAIPLLRYKVRSGDEDPTVISDCFTALIGLDPAESIPFVAQFLEGGDEPTQEAAAFALGEARRPEAFAPLRKFCENVRPGALQEAAFLALSMLRLPTAIDFLVSLVAAPDPSSARAALAALAIHRHNPAVHERVLATVSQTGNESLRTWFDKKFGAKD